MKAIIVDRHETRLPEVHQVLIDNAVSALSEFCVAEEPANLDEAIKCLRVLRLYVEPDPPLPG